MNCADVQDRMELFALGELAGGERSAFVAHVSSCPECRKACQECAGIAEAVREAAAPPEVRPSFAQETRDVLRREIRRGRRRTSRRILLAAAACLVAGLALWRWGLPGTPPPPSPSAARELWRFQEALAEPASAAGTMIVRGPRLYAVGSAAEGRRLAAVHVESGRTLWKSGIPFLGYLASDGDRVYGLSEGRSRSADLVALDAASGRLLWRHERETERDLEVPCPPAPAGGNRLYWPAGRSLLVLEADSGRLLRRHESPGRGGFAAPAARGEFVFSAHPSRLLCLKTGTGEVAWDLPVGPGEASLGRPLLAVGTRLCFAALPAPGPSWPSIGIDLGERREIWNRPLPRPRHLLAAGDDLYVRGDSILALDGLSGTPLWTRAASGCSPLTADDGLLQLVDTRGAGRFLSLDRRDGREVREIPGIRSCDAFVRGGNLGFLKTNDGVIHAYAF